MMYKPELFRLACKIFLLQLDLALPLKLLSRDVLDTDH